VGVPPWGEKKTGTLSNDRVPAMPRAAAATWPAIGGDTGTRVRCGTRAGRLRVGESPPRFYDVGKLVGGGVSVNGASSSERLSSNVIPSEARD